ncbi:hypothetical protein Tco_0561934 [Tanacetum coccineum]
MNGNKAYLAEYQDYNGGPIAFGGSKGYITGKGKIKIGKLDFEDVCFVKELQHFNLFSVSQMCDKKNKVLFTDTECLVCLLTISMRDQKIKLTKLQVQKKLIIVQTVKSSEARRKLKKPNKNTGLKKNEEPVDAMTGRTAANFEIRKFESCRFALWGFEALGSFWPLLLYGILVYQIGYPKCPKKVYKVVKALYGLHQAPRAWFQVTPKTSHLNAVKRIFRYLKGKPKLGLWYTRVSSFDLDAYSDSDYAGANLDWKSTIRGCQFLGRRLISWQCKKQTIVATSTIEAEYVAAANYYGQVLWIQNQMLDYGFNFMNTKIYIDNESTICILKNLVFHSKTKHIEIRHHFIRVAYEKKLIQVLKIHTDDNVGDLLTKAFDVSRVSSDSGLPLYMLHQLCSHWFLLWNSKDAQAAEILKLKDQIKKLKKEGRKNAKPEPEPTLDAFDDLDADVVIKDERQEDNVVEPRTPPTTTSIFDDEDITMAQTLIKMKEEKAKEKGIARDAEIARQLQVDLQAEVERERHTEEEASKAAIAETYDEVQARINANALLSRLEVDTNKSQTVVLLMTYIEELWVVTNTSGEVKNLLKFKVSYERKQGTRFLENLPFILRLKIKLRRDMREYSEKDRRILKDESNQEVMAAECITTESLDLMEVLGAEIWQNQESGNLGDSDLYEKCGVLP